MPGLDILRVKFERSVYGLCRIVDRASLGLGVG